jgi:hypothetical protein
LPFAICLHLIALPLLPLHFSSTTTLEKQHPPLPRIDYTIIIIIININTMTSQEGFPSPLEIKVLAEGK